MAKTIGAIFEDVNQRFCAVDQIRLAIEHVHKVNYNLFSFTYGSYQIIFLLVFKNKALIIQVSPIGFDDSIQTLKQTITQAFSDNGEVLINKVIIPDGMR